ncbi:MAG: hypothetical protein ACD_79C00373G0003 [uncultured bacterium]|nr:MAG: hypothetical protein ACD_79C00373G0003 [uncultured bacterium]
MDLLGDEIIYGDIGVSPATFPLIGGVKPKSPAEKCGLVKGDILKAVNEKEIIYWEEIVYIIQDNPLKTLKLSWLRNGKLMNAEITPEKKKIKIGDKEKEVGSIGVSASLPESMVIHRNVGFAEAFTTGAQRIYLYTVLTYKVLKKMILGKVSKDNLMGPVRLAGMATDFANEGFFPWLLFLGIVSHQLAIINLLPFPALDGGHAVFFIYEFIFRRKVSFKVLDIANRIGFSFLIALFIFVMGNDLLNIFKG